MSSVQSAQSVQSVQSAQSAPVTHLTCVKIYYYDYYKFPLFRCKYSSCSLPLPISDFDNFYFNDEKTTKSHFIDLFDEFGKLIKFDSLKSIKSHRDFVSLNALFKSK